MLRSLARKRPIPFGLLALAPSLAVLAAATGPARPVPARPAATAAGQAPAGPAATAPGRPGPGARDSLQAPAPARAAVLRFAALGDFGWDGTALRDVSALIHGWHPDLILALGDNNYDNGEASTIDANIGKYFHDYMHPYHGSYGAGAPENRFWACLGNHDWAAPGAAPYLAYFEYPGNERYYDFARGPVHFFALDSDPREPDGNTASSAQARWLMAGLKASASPWNIVFFHHPPFSSGRHGNNPAMDWPFRAWGAHAVLSGHDHTYERFDKDGFPYFVNGLGGRSLYPLGSPQPGSVVRYNADYGAQWIEATDRTLTFKFYDRAGTLIDSYTLDKAGGGASESMSFQNGAFPTPAYAGEADTYLSQAEPAARFGASPALIIDGDDPDGSGKDKRALLKWDVSAIPAGKTVIAASLAFDVTDVSPEAYPLYRVKRAWNAGGASWKECDSAHAWQRAGADGPADRDTTALGELKGAAMGTVTVPLNAAGVAVVQGWVDGSVPNQGIIILDAAHVNGLGISAGEAAAVPRRPKLTITFR